MAACYVRETLSLLVEKPLSVCISFPFLLVNGILIDLGRRSSLERSRQEREEKAFLFSDRTQTKSGEKSLPFPSFNKCFGRENAVEIPGLPFPASMTAAHPPVRARMARQMSQHLAGVCVCGSIEFAKLSFRQR